MNKKLIPVVLVAGLGLSGACHAASPDFLVGLQLGGIFTSLDYTPNNHAKSQNITSSDLKGGNGFALVASADYYITPNWRIGPSYIYSNEKIEIRNKLSTNGSPENIKESSSTVLANVHYDFEPINNISAYAGVGLGAAFFKNVKIHNSSTKISNVFAWAVDLGANYNINQNLALGLGYKYLGCGPGSINSDLAGDIGKVLSTGNIVTLGMFYRFGG